MNYKGSIILYWKNADQINTTSLANDYIVQYKKSTDSAYSVYTDGVSTHTYATLT